MDIRGPAAAVLDQTFASLWGLTGTAVPPDAFEWYKVSTAVNRAGADGPQIALPLEEEEE